MWEIAFWNCVDTEQLIHTAQEDAVEWYLDGLDEPFPEEIEVHGYARQVISPESLKGSVLEPLLENLDEEHGGPDEYTKPTSAMEAMEAALIQVVLAQYEVYACDRVVTEKVNVQDWLKEHCPHWLEKSAEEV